jgi:hypothetical protein
MRILAQLSPGVLYNARPAPAFMLAPGLHRARRYQDLLAEPYPESLLGEAGADDRIARTVRWYSPVGFESYMVIQYVTVLWIRERVEYRGDEAG